MPNPGGYRSYLWTFEKEEDLPQIVELMRPLRVAGVFGHVSQLRHSLVDIACLGDKEYYFRESMCDELLALSLTSALLFSRKEGQPHRGGVCALH